MTTLRDVFEAAEECRKRTQRHTVLAPQWSYPLYGPVEQTIWCYCEAHPSRAITVHTFSDAVAWFRQDIEPFVDVSTLEMPEVVNG